MIIHGIGIDIINVARIKNAVKKNKKFIKKIFSTNEIKYLIKKNLVLIVMLLVLPLKKPLSKL